MDCRDRVKIDPGALSIPDVRSLNELCQRHEENAMSEKPKMNLAERRAVAAYQESTYAEQLQQIIKAAGFDVAVDVKWETIAIAGQAERYGRPDFWTDIFFSPLVKALAAVTSDAMGKEALAATLKTITIHYDPDTAPGSAFENGVHFEDGGLTINFKPFANADYVDERARAIQNALEAGL
jgi:hypothetical protein